MARGHHPRLARQLEVLGIDPDADLDRERLAKLLQQIDQAYADADASQHTLHTVLDTLDSTTCHTDAQGILVGLNDPGLELFGLPVEQLLSRRLAEVVHLEDEDGNRLGTADLLRPQRVERGTLVRPDGRRVTVEISASPISTDRGGNGAVVRVRDIEARLAREQELREARVELLVARQAEQAKSLFLANMSHELRTPLNAIVGYAEILLEEADDSSDPQRVADLRRIQAAGNHLTQLIGAVLDLSKIEAGHMALRPEPCAVVDVIKEARDAVMPQVLDKGLKLRLWVSGPPPTLWVDRMRLRQAVLNLLSNAVKFTDEGGVGIEVFTLDDSVHIAVTDSGVGISAEELARIFGDFVQVGGRDRQVDGTGLGLALSRRLVRLMGGDIKVGSVLGEGSTFTIVLPLAAEE